jgi:hypothetical protein
VLRNVLQRTKIQLTDDQKLILIHGITIDTVATVKKLDINWTRTGYHPKNLEEIAQAAQAAQASETEQMQPLYELKKSLPEQRIWATLLLERDLNVSGPSKRDLTFNKLWESLVNDGAATGIPTLQDMDIFSERWWTDP